MIISLKRLSAIALITCSSVALASNDYSSTRGNLVAPEQAPEAIKETLNMLGKDVLSVSNALVNRAMEGSDDELVEVCATISIQVRSVGKEELETRSDLSSSNSDGIIRACKKG